VGLPELRAHVGAMEASRPVTLDELEPGLVVDWLRRDLGYAERCTVRVERIRRGRVEIAHELGFCWVWPHELVASLTVCAAGVRPSVPPSSPPSDVSTESSAPVPSSLRRVCQS
jgi:hypothetical protein